MPGSGRAKPPRLGTKPEAKAKRRQKDTEALGQEKRREALGYKNPINAGQQHRLIQSYAVTSASVHDSQVFDELLDPTEDTEGNKRTVYANSAYCSEAQEQRLAYAKTESQICEKGSRDKPVKEEQKAIEPEQI